MERGRKRMGREVQPSALEVVAHGDQHEPSEFKLPVVVVGVPQDPVVDANPALSDLLQERNKAGLQFGKNGLERGDGGTGLVHVQQRIVGRILVVEIPSLFAFQRQYGAEVREKHGEPVLLLGLGPDLLGERTFAAECNDKIRRQLLGPAEVPPDLPQQRAGRLIPQVAGLFIGQAAGRIDPLRQELFNVRGHQLLVSHALQDGDLLCPRFAPAGRHIGFLIP
jgi:hypothetical protein